jgi:lactococcin 972 family bacteriocin
VKNKIAIVIMTVLLGIGIFSSVAMATTKNVGGGVWDYGHSLINVYSDYYHRTAKHGSTACVNAYCTAKSVAKNLTSHATRSKGIFDSTQVFWHKN